MTSFRWLKIQLSHAGNVEDDTEFLNEDSISEKNEKIELPVGDE